MADLTPGQSYRVIFEGVADDDGHLDLPNGTYLTTSHVGDATRVEPVSNVTPLRSARRARSVKVEDALWEAAKARADERGEVLSEVIREALKRYVKGEK